MFRHNIPQVFLAVVFSLTFTYPALAIHGSPPLKAIYVNWIPYMHYMLIGMKLPKDLDSKGIVISSIILKPYIGSK